MYFSLVWWSLWYRADVVSTVNNIKPQPNTVCYSKLLQALDHAVEVDTEGVREAVQDKTYMVQLVQVSSVHQSRTAEKTYQVECFCIWSENKFIYSQQDLSKK